MNEQSQPETSPAPGADHCPSAHAVQFYDDAWLCEGVATFLNEGVAADAALIVIATATHRQAITARLAARGPDVARLCSGGQLVLLDAEETLARFMVGGIPDWTLFKTVVGAALEAGAAWRDVARVRAYGEMVDVLWRTGRPQAAIRVEEMWNHLAESYSFDLLCAYVMGNFQNGLTGESGMRPVCASPDQVVAPHEAGDEPGGARSDARSDQPPDKRRDLARVPQPSGDAAGARGASDLAAEIAARKELENELRQSIRDLRRAEDQARATADRMGELQKATARMATALNVASAGEILLSVSERVLGACAGVFYLADEENRFQLEACQGVTAKVQQLKVLPLDSPLPLSTAIKTGTAVWIEEYASLMELELYPNLSASSAASTLQAVVAVPLLQGTRVLGGFALSFGSPRKFDHQERQWLESFASQCGLAIERAHLYEREQRARREAETLFRITESLNSAQLDLEAIAQRVTDEATALAGAQVGAFFYNVPSAEGGSRLLYTVSGAPKAFFARFGVPRNRPIFAPPFPGEGVIRLDDVRKDPRFAQPPPEQAMPPGPLRVASYLAVPVMGRDGSVIGGLCLGHDEVGRFTLPHERMMKALAVSAAVAVENANLFRGARDADEKHRRLVTELTETVRMNELFAGVLAHDLRNPLTAIMTAAELALARTSEERVTRPMGRILKSGDRMLRMIEQLLDFTRIRVGSGMSITAQPTDLMPLLRQVADELRAGVPEAPITIAIAHTGDTSGAWDEDRLGQAFSNLLGNALQHGTPGSPVRVEVDGTGADEIAVRVCNDGVMPTTITGHVFEAFVAGGRQREKSRGLGLGLFITREIARAHGGSVTVASTEGAGTTFSLSLPRFARVRPTALQPVAITPLRAAEEELQGSEERLRLLVDTVKDYAIFMLDPTGIVKSWNAGAERIKGYTAAEVIDRHFSIFFPERDIASGLCRQELERAARDGRMEHEGWRVRKDGSKFWASVVVTALRHPKGELLGFAKVTRDLTERRKLDAERIRLVHAQEAIRLRDEFLSVVSHELKTPLAGLQIQLENLQRRLEKSDQLTSTQLRRATDSGRRLGAVIQSLLDASRIATGRMALAPARFDLAEAVGDVVKRHQELARKAGCQLSCQLEQPLWGIWDRDRLEQAVSNLLANAVKYGAGSRVEISLGRVRRSENGGGDGRRGDCVSLQIRDHGPGVPHDALTRIFGRFERAVSIQHHGGLGLGLYVVREIIAAHGGTITAENVPDGGARFTLSLPVRDTGTIATAASDAADAPREERP